MKIKISYVNYGGYTVVTKVTREQLRLLSKIVNVTIL